MDLPSAIVPRRIIRSNWDNGNFRETILSSPSGAALPRRKPSRRYSTILSLTKPGVGKNVSSRTQRAARYPASSFNSRRAAVSGDSPDSMCPATSSQRERPTAWRYCRTMRIFPSGKMGSRTTEPRCSTTSRTALIFPGSTTRSRRTLKTRPRKMTRERLTSHLRGSFIFVPVGRAGSTYQHSDPPAAHTCPSGRSCSETISFPPPTTAPACCSSPDTGGCTAGKLESGSGCRRRAWL